MIPSTVLRIERPEFESVPKGSVANAGAEAIVQAAPGLIALLDAPIAGATYPLGSGYQAPLTVPFGLAVTAAIGALGMPDPLQDRWMVRSAAIRWLRSATHDDVIRARATVSRVGERDAIVNARASGSGDLVLETEIRLVPVNEGRYAAFDAGRLRATASAPAAAGSSGEATPATATIPPLLRVRPIRIVTAEHSSEIEFQPDVLDLLTHSVGGRREPLGRRAHPLGGAPLGAALTAALFAAGETDPDRPTRNRITRADATWYAPLPPNEPWRARARPSPEAKADTATVDVLTCRGRSVLAASIHWAAA
jgi:acyl-CoA thioesterase FadM